MAKLLIYVPTYNGVERLKLYVRRFLAESAALAPGQVRLHINDNATPNADFAWLQGQPGITLTRNEVNIGAARNFNKVFEFNQGDEFTWAMGDDDLLMPGSLLRILSIIEDSNQPVDFICTNTVTFENVHKQRLTDGLDRAGGGEITLEGGTAKAQPDNKVHHVSFRNLINPQIDEVLLGSVMLSIYRTSKVRDCSSASFPEGTRLSVFSAYPHCTNFAGSLDPEAPSVYDSFLHTCNFWDGGNSWKAEYDIVVGLGLIHSVMKYAEHGHLNPAHERDLVAHYLAIGGTALKRLARSPDAALRGQIAPIADYLLGACLKYGIQLP